MEQRILGNSGIPVSAIGLGCMSMTAAYDLDAIDEAESLRAIHRAIDLGITFIDTADVYGPHTNEVLVGRALKDRRDEVVLSTKCGYLKFPDGSMARDGRPEHLRAGIDGSLQRLGVDHVDLWQLHRVDPNVPVEESWAVFAEAAQAGKTRAVGLSEATLDEVKRCHAIHPVASVQSELSLWTREWLDELIPWLAENDIAFIAFSPLGRGFLTGALTPDRTFAPEDTRAAMPRFQAEALAANQRLIDTLKEIAARQGATVPQVAIAWVLSRGRHVIPIPGTRRTSRVEENAGAADVVLSPEDLAALDALPPAEGTRY